MATNPSSGRSRLLGRVLLRAAACGLAWCAWAPAVSAQPVSAQPAPAQPAPAQPVTPATPDPNHPAPAAPPNQWGGMNAGGLAPPPPLGGDSPGNGQPTGNGQPANGTANGQSNAPSGVASELDDSKDDDAGRGLSWFWLEAQGGFEHVGLQTFNIDEENLSAGFVEKTASGGVVSAGIGAQIIFITLGARGRIGVFPDWQLARVGGELGFKIPIGFVEPRFDLGGGYAAMANFENGVVPEAISITGFYARASAGVDFYPADILAIGALASFDFMGLARPGVSPADIAALQSSGSIDDAEAGLLAAEGSGYGSTFAIQATVGLHF